ncbi:MAG TPA: Ig-like domain-containing protein [Marmoricola sp.]|nr:Ig-like domain-containing protein [Marmoricola sp.]
MTTVLLVATAAVGSGVVLPVGADAVYASDSNPTSNSVAPAGVNGCHSTDNGDPRLVEFRYSPGRVDVVDASARVRFRVRASDTGGPGPSSGVGAVSVYFGAGPGDEGGTEIHDLVETSHGWWTGAVTVPRRAPHERWQIEGLDLRDRAGNREHVGRAELQGLTGRRLSVAITTAPDRTPSRLVAFSVTPDTVDTTRAVQFVVFTARMVDRQSDIGEVVVDGTGDTSWLSPETGTISLTMVPGTRHLFSARVPVRRWLGMREWRTTAVGAWNSADQLVVYRRRQLADLGFDGDFSVVSGRDTTRPEVRSFDVSARAVDTRTEDAELSFTVHATDVGAGVRRVVASGSQEEFWIELTRTSGTARDGVWSGTLPVQHCRTSSATWRLMLIVEDGQGDRSADGVVYDSADLAARGWQDRVRVTGGDIERPQVAVAPRVRPGGPIRIAFDEPVQGIETVTASLHHLRGDGSLGRVRAGTWRCRDGIGLRTNCRSGSVEQARFRPDDLLRVNARYGLALNPEHQLGITDLAGNPLRQTIRKLRVTR